ncbi:MAG: D-alanyl-D-alanine carboxypeptidase family protein, partial [Flavobacterium sp.]
MTNIGRLPAFQLDPRKLDPTGVGAKLRATVVDRLLTAQEALPDGIRFLIIEGYRRPALQQRYFDEHRADVARMHPEWGPERLIHETSKHVAPPAVAAHPCGAAVDLTLVRDGLELDLGTPVNATPEDSDHACFTAAENIT